MIRLKRKSEGGEMIRMKRERERDRKDRENTSTEERLISNCAPSESIDPSQSIRVNRSELIDPSRYEP